MRSDFNRHAERLGAGLESLGVAADATCRQRLLDYLAELADWNRAFNLTAVRDPEQMVVRHLLDSAAVAPWLAAGELLDVGAGAGLPGIPLAILEPERPVALLDANGKKARFMRHAIRALGLGNARVLEERFEDCSAGPFPAIIARAFAEPAALLAGAKRLSAPGGAVLAMVGRLPVPIPRGEGFEHERSVALEVPGLDAQRHLLIYRRWPESSQ